jgi:phosphoribosyl 1,2-cyclic phosphate phosphodiesterase
MRTSAFVEVAPGTNILIDSTTDLRHQALAWGLTRVDAVLYTHSHADHILGIDDLRAFNYVQGGPIPCYGTKATFDDIRSMFSYAFNPNPLYQGGGVPRLMLNEISGEEELEVCGARVLPIPLIHGKLPVLGYRIGSLAYLTDTNFIPPESRARLSGLSHLILDGLRFEPHPSHFSIPEAIEVAREIGANQTWLIHMTHSVDYDAINSSLPAGIQLAYDGLSLEF